MQISALCYLIVVAFLPVVIGGDGGKKKKDLTDYTEADLERLYEEWGVCFLHVLTPIYNVISRKTTAMMMMRTTIEGDRHPRHKSI